eukprot:jgi/Galph1/2523/GphlegSOOS_G1216.1
MWVAKGNKASSVSRDTTKLAQVAKDGIESQICVVCANVLSLVAFGTCNHVHVCASCTHRLRFLYKDYNCCVCKQHLEKVVAMNIEMLIQRLKNVGQKRKSRLFDSIDLTGLFLEDKTNMYFVEEGTCEKFRSLLTPSCSICLERLPSVKSLQTHVQVTHGGRYCFVCLNYRKAYLVEQTVYNSKKELDDHFRQEHPCCLFCRRNYYDDDHLFEHLTQIHETCHICERNGRQYEYYRNYEALEGHFKEHHFPCLEPNCRGVVFSTEFELQLHNQREHSKSSSSGRRARAVTVNLSNLYLDSNASIEQGHRIRHSREERERQRRGFYNARIYFTGEGSAVTGSRRNRAQSLENRTNADSTGTTESVQEPENGSFGRERCASVGESRETTQVSVKSPTREEFPSHAMNSSVTFVVPPRPSTQEDYTRRNQALLVSLRELLGTDSSYEKFVKISGQLRKKEIEVSQYLSETIDLLGISNARRILPELVALLPDKEIAMELEDAAKRHSILSNRSVTVDNQVVVSDQLHAQHPDKLNSQSEKRPIVEKDFPSLQSVGNNSVVTEVSRNIASGRWKQLSYVVAPNLPTDGSDVSIDITYPSLSSVERGASSNGTEQKNNVWNSSNKASKNPSSVSANGVAKEERKQLSESLFPPLNNERVSHNVSNAMSSKTTSSVSDAASSSKKNNNSHFRTSRLPKVGLSGFSWEKKRNKKRIQMAKSKLQENTSDNSHS